MVNRSILGYRVRNSLFNDLLGFWRLDEASGTVLDSSGNAYNGTASGGITRNVSGKIRTAYQFGGVDGSVVINSASLLSALNGRNVLSVSFWANALLYENNKCAFSIGDDGTGNMLSFYPYYNAGGKGGFNGVAVWYNGETIMNPASALLADGTWNNFIYVQNGATSHELFINGVSVASATNSKSISASIDMVAIGAYGDGEEFYTRGVDHVKVWKKALNALEISTEKSYVD